jgi:hypothetical protein
VDPNWNPKLDPVMWEEGLRYWVMNETDRWVQAQRQLSLPLGAGPSGNTNTIMQAGQVLGGVDPYDTRLLCMAYMMPARHHTLVEIMAGAEPHGADYTKGQGMYRDIKPLSKNELKGCRAGGLFPDEIAGDQLDDK